MEYLLYLWDPDDQIRGIKNSTPGVSGPMAGVSGCYSTAGVRSATPAEAAMASCKLKILSSGGQRVMLQAAAGRGAHAWCSLLDACKAEVKGRDRHT